MQSAYSGVAQSVVYREQFEFCRVQSAYLEVERCNGKFIVRVIPKRIKECSVVRMSKEKEVVMIILLQVHVSEISRLKHFAKVFQFSLRSRVGRFSS